MKIFIDASFWIAQFRKDDAHRQKALALSKLLKPVQPVYTNNLVIYESLTVIAIRVNRGRAIDFGRSIFEGIDRGAVLSSVADETRERKIWEIFQNISKKDVSFTDCSILQTIKEFDIDRLFTFDRHFELFQKEFRFKINDD